MTTVMRCRSKPLVKPGRVAWLALTTCLAGVVFLVIGLRRDNELLSSIAFIPLGGVVIYGTIRFWRWLRESR